MITKEELEDFNARLGKMVDEHSSWVYRWTMANLPQGETKYISVLISGLAISCAVFVREVSKHNGLSMEVMKTAFLNKFEEEVSR